MFQNALASLAVADLDAAVEWYERLLGPGRRVVPPVHEWRFERGGALQVYQGVERAGHGSCTLVVDDIAALAEHLRRVGVDGPAPTRDAAVDTLMVRDPEGNSIAFSVPHDPSLAR